MARETENVTLGAGRLYLDDVEVGHLKGVVELACIREMVDFKPADMTAPTKIFVIRESAELKATQAEFNVTALRLALGHTAAVPGSSTSLPAYQASASFDSTAGSSYDYITFGGYKTVQETSLRFEHTRPNAKKIVVIFYQAVSLSEITIPFDEENVTLYDVTYRALADEDRSAGDQMGVIIDEVQAT